MYTSIVSKHVGKKHREGAARAASGAPALEALEQRQLFSAAIAPVSATAPAAAATAALHAAAAPAPTQDQLNAIAAEAYVYGYPLVLAHLTEQASTNAPNAAGRRRRGPSRCTCGCTARNRRR